LLRLFERAANLYPTKAALKKVRGPPHPFPTGEGDKALLLLIFSLIRYDKSESHPRWGCPPKKTRQSRRKMLIFRFPPSTAAQHKEQSPDYPSTSDLCKDYPVVVEEVRVRPSGSASTAAREA